MSDVVWSAAPGYEDIRYEKSEDGIDIYTRMTDASPVREFRAETTMPVPMADLVDALNAVHEHTQWMAGVGSAKKVALAGTDTVLYYVIDIPIPFADRDMVLTSDKAYTNHDSAYHLRLAGAADLLPEEDGVVRMPFVRGSWHFNSLSEHTTAVTYQFVSDPGGRMPDWLVNAFIIGNTHKTLRDLLAHLESK